jgi:tetratricopeptide (TPR) repeat protein
VDPIIRTCSLFALSLALFAQPAEAKRDTPQSALGRYVEARIADNAGANAQALAAYSAALTADPSSPAVALRAYRQAIEVGDKPLALRALRSLGSINALPVDGRILLLSEAFARSDWRGAQSQIDRMEEAGTFAFMTPVLRAWTLQGSGLGDPLTGLSARPSDGLSMAYTQEHRGLILLARKQVEEGVAAVSALRSSGLSDSRGLPLRLAAAQRLAELKRADAALSLLAGDQSILVTARQEIAAGRPIANSIVRPQTGMAMLLSRVANDLIRDNASPVALTLARLASFADPSFGPAKLALARALSANGNPKGALATLDALPKGRVNQEMAGELRLDLLLAGGQLDAALALGTARANQADATTYDQARLGEVLARMDRRQEAAAAYGKAIELAAGPARDRPVPWNLWLLLGREYDMAKDWAKAKPALQRAAALAPNEPSALNHLGYAMLVNGESVSEATRLLEKASKLRPDDSAITDSFGWALFKSGRLNEAIPVLERAAESEPTVAEIGEHLGDAYWAVGRRIDARYAWRAAKIQAEEADLKRLTTKIEFGPDARP